MKINCQRKTIRKKNGKIFSSSKLYTHTSCSTNTEIKCPHFHMSNMKNFWKKVKWIDQLNIIIIINIWLMDFLFISVIIIMMIIMSLVRLLVSILYYWHTQRERSSSMAGNFLTEFSIIIIIMICDTENSSSFQGKNWKSQTIWTLFFNDIDKSEDEIKSLYLGWNT